MRATTPATILQYALCTAAMMVFLTATSDAQTQPAETNCIPSKMTEEEFVQCSMREAKQKLDTDRSADVAGAALLSSTLAGNLASPWKATTADTIAAQPTSSDSKFGWKISFTCSATKGFGALMLAPTPDYAPQISEILAKAGTAKAIPINFQQDRLFPSIVRLDGIDALELSILDTEILSLKITTLYGGAEMATYTFARLKASKMEVLKRCPPF